MMKIRKANLWAVELLLVLALLLCAFSSCTRQSSDDLSETSLGGQEDTAEDIESLPSGQKTETDYRIVYKSIEFLSAKDREAWREPLVRLLSNEALPVIEGDSLMGYTPLYPDRPCIDRGYHLGLFDFDLDGVPELLVNLGGGSAGNAFYHVYDILSGELIGSLDGGLGGAWCMYFNLDEGRYEAIGQFEWRMGWQGKQRFIHKATLSHTMSNYQRTLSEFSWIDAYYGIDAVQRELTEEEIKAGIHSAWEEVYTDVRFYVNGSKADIQDYFSAYDRFTEQYVRIPETALVLFRWDDVCSSDEELTARAEKMTDALLSSAQEFIRIGE